MRSDQRDECLRVEWLSEIAARPGTARELRGTQLVRGDEDDRRELAFRDQSRLQLEPVQAAKVNVEHEASRLHGHGVVEILLRRAERHRSDPVSSEHPGERLSNRRVVVDDSYPGLSLDRHPRR